MGKGDKKSRRGKIILGSYGVRRPQHTAGKSYVKPANYQEKEKISLQTEIEENAKISVEVNEEVSKKEILGSTGEVRKTTKKAPKKAKESPEA